MVTRTDIHKVELPIQPSEILELVGVNWLEDPVLSASTLQQHLAEFLDDIADVRRISRTCASLGDPAD
jgi:hypothetical protein